MKMDMFVYIFLYFLFFLEEGTPCESFFSLQCQGCGFKFDAFVLCIKYLNLNCLYIRVAQVEI